MPRGLIFRASMVIVALAAMTMDACSDDDSDEDAVFDATIYCPAALALESTPPPDLGDSTDPNEIEDIVRDYANDTLEPRARTAADAASSEVEESLDVMVSAIDEVGGDGDFEELDSESFAEAAQRVHDYDLATCGWSRVDVTATEYAFAGLSPTLIAGPTSFELSNRGAEYHELVVVRKNEGVVQSAQELLALPSDEALELLTFVNQGDADPGAKGYVVADLTPGAYVVACFVPVGTTSADAEPVPDAAPHTSQGMYAEFTVG